MYGMWYLALKYLLSDLIHVVDARYIPILCKEPVLDVLFNKIGKVSNFKIGITYFLIFFLYADMFYFIF